MTDRTPPAETEAKGWTPLVLALLAAAMLLCGMIAIAQFALTWPSGEWLIKDPEQTLSYFGAALPAIVAMVIAVWRGMCRGCI